MKLLQQSVAKEPEVGGNRDGEGGEGQSANLLIALKRQTLTQLEMKMSLHIC